MSSQDIKKENTKDQNVHAGHRERMRKRFFEKGIDSFQDHEILEFLLYYVYRNGNTNPIGHALMDKFKTIDGVFGATYDELCSVKGVGEKGAILIMYINELRNRLSRSSVEKKVRLATHRDAADYCFKFFEGLSSEKFILISLNSKRDVIAADVISDGTCSASSVDIRRIMEIVLLRKPSGVILSHNHPGDSPHPSSSDLAVTSRIIDLLEGIDIAVIDHIICSGKDYCSLSERGMLEAMGTQYL